MNEWQSNILSNYLGSMQQKTEHLQNADALAKENFELKQQVQQFMEMFRQKQLEEKTTHDKGTLDETIRRDTMRGEGGSERGALLRSIGNATLSNPAGASVPKGPPLRKERVNKETGVKEIIESTDNWQTWYYVNPK